MGGGFSKSFKNLDDMRAEKKKMAQQEVEELKKQEHAKKEGVQKKPKKKPSLGIKILKNTVTTRSSGRAPPILLRFWSAACSL